jgi:hypothetical protein
MCLKIENETEFGDLDLILLFDGKLMIRLLSTSKKWGILVWNGVIV